MTPDRLATATMISEVETMIKVSICKPYKEFLQQYGGGNYWTTVVYSADALSFFYLPRAYSRAKKFIPIGYLPFSEDFCGGYYLFAVDGTVVYDHVYYWHIDGGVCITEYI